MDRRKKSVASVLGVILGGGRGSRLFPLTRERSKPAVPMAGKYRLVDFPVSNCINSGIRNIYVLTQFNSVSLHRHIQQSFKFDRFSPGFVHILAAQQTPDGSAWYQGNADAVRQNMRHILQTDTVIPIPGLSNVHQVDNVAKAVMERRELDVAERQELEEAGQKMLANLPKNYAWLKDWEYV